MVDSLVPDVVEAEASVEVRPEAVAPWPHTVFLLAVLAIWATYGAMRWRWPVSVMPHLVTYTSSILVQCLLVGTTIAGLYHRRRFVMGVLGRFSVARILPDLGSGFLVFLGGWATMLVVGLALRPLHPAAPTGVVRAMAPHTGPELALWMLVSLSAGVGEEFVFRGYLLRQFTRWWGSPALAIAGTAVLFGCMHFYEGGNAVVLIGALGALFGLIAVRRGDLRTVMVAHFLQDAFTGYFLYLHR